MLISMKYSGHSCFNIQTTRRHDTMSISHRLSRVSRLTAGPALAILAAGCVLSAPDTANASDYYHTCRTVDGQYVMQGDTLQKSGPDGDGVGPAIAYSTTKTIVLKERRGYCVGSREGRRYPFEGRTYVKEISFWSEGRKTATTMLCELASDGMPANTNCAREVVTQNWALAAGQPPARTQDSAATGGQGDQSRSAAPNGGSLWNHNGSVMRLVAEGDSRRIYYERPRSGLRQRGVRRGELLFEGHRNGDTYAGTAFIFTSSCGKVAYDVAGAVQPGETVVIMEGEAPRLNSRCEQVGSRPDRLVFTLQR
jgi:hypothetical protein